MNKMDKRTTGEIKPLLPKTDPLEDNPNPWNYNTPANNFLLAKRPVEIQLDTGEHTVLRSPSLYSDIAKRVIFWRWHQEIEKMPFWIKFVWHRRFTFKDRVRILFGKNLVFPIAVACRNSPGAVQPVVIGYVTDSTDAGDYMMKELKAAASRYLTEQAKAVEP